MATTKDILQLQTRAARDRVIDLLGIGETYPVQDVVVQEEQLTVDFGKESSFYIEPGQKDVKYELYDGFLEKVEDVKADKLVGSCDHGTGEKTTILGPTIKEDKVFQILATKIDPPGRKVFLTDMASIKVGLDTSLNAWIERKSGVDLLNPTSTSGDPPNTAPRIADYGIPVDVKVERSQPGAEYRLIDHKGNEISQSSVWSEGDEITLVADPIKVKEDMEIRIGVKRTFKPSEGLQDFPEQMLDAKLPLAVRANPEVGVSIDGGPLVDPMGDVHITIAGSQKNVEYSAYVRTLIDGDFEFELDPESTFDPESTDAIKIEVPASLDVRQHIVYVKRPQLASLPPDGYTRRALLMPDTDGDLTLNIRRLPPNTAQDRIEDGIIVITARKDHRHAMFGEVSIDGVSEDERRQFGQSTVQLQQVVVALARPEPRELTLTLDDTKRTLLVSGGQQGVFYHFRPPSDPPAQPPLPEIGLPAYFHRLEDMYRGVDHLRIEMDLVPVRDGPDGRPPPDPLLEVTLDPPAPAALDVMAVKARTRVGWSQSRTNTITILIQEP